ncbi:MAG: carbohydrate porin [Phycisphaerae bacterium]|nr:carbohydrate porin [Phycisphaerae bacterium]
MRWSTYWWVPWLLATPGAAETTEIPPTTRITPSATTQPAETQPSGEDEPYSLLTAERLIGNWGGARTRLEERGLTFSLGLTSIYQGNAHGGLRTRGADRFSGSVDLETTFDLEAMRLLQGGTLYIYTQGSWDDGVSGHGHPGDYFGVNGDATGDEAIDVLEMWYEQSLLDKQVRVRVGKINLSVDFDTNAYANDETSQFLNGGLINTFNLPFPGEALGSLGAQVIVAPGEWFYFGAGIADAQADWRETGLHTAFHEEDNFTSLFEAGFTPTFKTPWGVLPGGYRVGLWYDPQPKAKFFDDLDGRRLTVPHKSDDTGFYTSLDQMVFKEKPGEDDDHQGLGLFFRYGYAPGDVNELNHFWSIGSQYLGLIPTRDEDVVGFGVAQGILSDRLKLQGDDPGRETALELYYALKVTGWLTISPDFQWILNPGGRHEARDAFVAGVRFQAAF